VSLIGQIIGNYRVVSELGKGGMGVVYLAEHVQLGRPAALKMLLPQLSSDEGIVQRFFNEARSASAIDHPGIVEIYDFGTHTDGRAYLVMALLKGETLEQRLRRGRMEPLEGATIVAQVAGALAAAHAQGIVHRDLKPDNIFLVPNELLPGGTQVKLLDFGIAKLAGEQSAGVKTRTGVLIGTPAYMSPEQCMGRSDLDHRTDLYALGCILFHVLCGRPPFLSEHGTGVMIAAHMRDAPPDPRTLNPRVPGALVTIVLCLLEKEPSARYQTALELRNALVAAGANAPITRIPAGEPYAPTVALGPYSTGLPTHGGPPAPTTRSASAAQVVAPPRAPGGKKLGVWIGVGALLAGIAGVGVFAAIRRDGTQAPASPQAVPPSPATPVVRADSVPPSPVTPAARADSVSPPAVPAARPDGTTPPPSDAAAEAACARGQTRGDDTQGHCCWPEQAWSTSKARCVGLPRCPPGMIGHGEQCVAEPARIVSRQAPAPAKPPSSPQAVALAAPTFRLAASSYAPGAAIQIRFAHAISSTPDNRAWVAVVERGAPGSSYGTWKYVDDRASSAVLEAPRKDGAYEVRLHTDYPAKSYNVVHAEPFTVTTVAITDPGETPRAEQRFTVASKSVRSGARIDVRFAAPMHAASGERFWITIVARDTPDSTWGTYEYVPEGARGLKLEAPAAAGDYEVRLHANYPKQTTNVVHRATIRVEGE